MSRPRHPFPAYGRLQTTLTEDQFAALDALADYWNVSRNAAIGKMLDEATVLRVAFDLAEQDAMRIRPAGRPPIHLRHIVYPGMGGVKGIAGQPLFLWCHDPDVLTGIVGAAESASCMDPGYDVRRAKIPRTTIAKALQWARLHPYKPSGW